MKSKKLIALLLSFVMLFSFAVPVFASADTQVSAVAEEGITVSVFSRIKEIFHSIVERIMKLIGRECPLCKNEGAELPSAKEEIAAAYNDAVNSLKEYKGKVTVIKSTDIDIEISDLLPQVAKTIIEAVAETLEGRTVNTYVFRNGTDSDNVKLTDRITPCGREASLDAAGLVSASSKKYGSGSVIEFQLKNEVAHYDGTNVTVDAVYNRGITDTLNPAVLDLGPVTVTQAEIAYPCTSVRAELDSEGRLVRLSVELPVEMDAVCKTSVISVRTVILTTVKEEYIFSYGA